MKKGIHPEYSKLQVVCTSCGNAFESGSTFEGETLKVDTCSNCHPFYTGRQRFVTADGRVERFMKKYGIEAEAEPEAEKE